MGRKVFEIAAKRLEIGHYRTQHVRSLSDMITIVVIDFFIKCSKSFTVLERVIEELHFLLCNPLIILLHSVRNGAQEHQQSSAHYLNG